MKFTIEEFLAMLLLPGNEKWIDGVWDVEPYEKDGVRLVLFAPRGVDHQTFHQEDELYFIVRGSGKLVIGAESHDFAPGDAFFVGAKVAHRFEGFTEDFVTWLCLFERL